MKKILTMYQLLILLVISAMSVGISAQQTINGSITHDNGQRSYTLYVPASYSGNTPVPLVLNFHGYTSSATVQMNTGDFRAIADTAGFIIVHPQGSLFNGNTHWNVGGWTVGSTADDVGFTSALLDSLSAEYLIDPDRVYSTGFSNGGYFSFKLACQLGDRIAAIASVAGSMTPEIYNACSPTHSTPVLQMHGTNDNVVPYNGANWTRSIDDAMQYWVDYNNCETTPVTTALEDINTSDGSTVEHIVYHGGDNGATAEHYKITGGRHTWPGNAQGGFGTNMDINASVEIWRFFSRYDINGLMNPTGIREIAEQSPNNFRLSQNFPNPFNPSTIISFTIPEAAYVVLTVYNTLGESVAILAEENLSAGAYQYDWQAENLPGGVYFYRLQAGNFQSVKKAVLLK